MSDKLKPCPFNIGDKVKLVDIGFHSPQIIIGYEINRFGNYEYSLAESIENSCPVGVTNNVDEKYFTLVDSTRALCPNTLEAAAKVASNFDPMGNSEWHRGFQDAQRIIEQKIRSLKGES